MRKKLGVIVLGAIVILFIIVTFLYYQIPNVKELIDVNASLVAFFCFLMAIPPFLYLFLSEEKKTERETTEKEESVPVHHPGTGPVLPPSSMVTRKNITVLKVAAAALAVMAVIVAVTLIIIFSTSVLNRGVDSEISSLQLEIDQAQSWGVPIENAQHELEAAQDSMREQKTKTAREYIEKAYIELQLSIIQWKIEEIKRISSEYGEDISKADEFLEKTKQTFQGEKYPYDMTKNDLNYTMQFVDARLLTIAAEYYVKQAEPLITVPADMNQKVEAATSSFNNFDYNSAIDQATGALKEMTERLFPKVESDITEATRAWLNPTVSNSALQRARQYQTSGVYWKAIEEVLGAELELQVQIGTWMNSRANTNTLITNSDFNEFSSRLNQARHEPFSEAFNNVTIVQKEIIEKAKNQLESNLIRINELQIDITEAENLLKFADKENNLQKQMEIILLANMSFEIHLADRCIEVAQSTGADMSGATKTFNDVKGKFNSSTYSEDVDLLTEARKVQESALGAALNQLTKRINDAEAKGQNVKQIRSDLERMKNSLLLKDYIGALKKLLEIKKNLDALNQK